MRKVIVVVLISLIASIHQAVAFENINDPYDPTKRIKPKDILGIGSAEIDILTLVTDDYIKRNLTIPYGIQKNTVSLTDVETWNILKKHIDNYIIVPSGQVAGLLFCYSSLGGKSAFNAMLADDEYSNYLIENFSNLGIDLINKSKLSSNQTKVNLMFISENGSSIRVGLINHNASKISQKDIKYHLIKDYKMIVAESALWDGNGQSKAIIRAFNIAEKVGTARVLLLSDINRLKQHKDDFINLVSKLDIIITNESAIKELTNAKDIDSLLVKLKKFNKLIVVTLGKSGAVIVDGSNAYFIEGSLIDKSKIVDKTRTQEAFAAGFLYGLTNNMSILNSGKLAVKASTYIIQQIGDKPVDNLAEILNDNFIN